MQETQTPKVKSKNIDVVSEYKKVKRKKAANFVVIGKTPHTHIVDVH